MWLPATKTEVGSPGITMAGGGLALRRLVFWTRSVAIEWGETLRFCPSLDMDAIANVLYP